MSATPYPAFGRFLAGHFGGYPTLADAASQEADGDEAKYVEDFIRNIEELTEDAMRSAEAFLASWWQKTEVDREADYLLWFTDAGNPIPGKMPPGVVRRPTGRRPVELTP